MTPLSVLLQVRYRVELSQNFEQQSNFVKIMKEYCVEWFLTQCTMYNVHGLSRCGSATADCAPSLYS